MNTIFGRFVGGRAAIGLLIIRVFMGLGLAIHGYGKLTGQAGPFHWADKMGVPSFLQGLAVLSEFGGGLAMIAGLLTPLAMLGIIITMAVAIIKVHLPQGASYVSGTGGPSYELAAHYLIVAAGLLLTGPGTLSLDWFIFGRRYNDPTYVP